MDIRWNSTTPFFQDKNGNERIEIHSTKEKADRSYYLLKRMLDMGADINALDSYDRNGLWRFCIQASNILPQYNYAEDCERKGRVFTKELESDMKRILVLLKDAGVDQNQLPKDMSGSPKSFYRKGSLNKLLEDVFK